MEGRTQPWLINDLITKFRDPKVKRLYQAKSKEKIAHNLITRMFDDFDALVPSSELEQIAVDFIKLLPGIKKFIDEKGEVADLEAPQITLVDRLINGIIDIGILELFDDDKNIRKELVALLDWENLKSKAAQAYLLNAFIGGIFQQIYVKYPESINERPEARQCAEKYINSHYKKMVIAILLQRNHLTLSEANTLSSATKQESIFNSPTVVAGITTGVVLGAGLLALLGVFLGSAGKASSSVNEKQKKPETEKLPEPY